MYGRIFQMKDKDGEEDNVISLLKTQARQRIEGVIATNLVALDNSSVNSYGLPYSKINQHTSLTLTAQRNMKHSLSSGITYWKIPNGLMANIYSGLSNRF